MAIWVDKLEKRFGGWAIPNLTFWIMIGQIAVYGFGLFTNFPVHLLSLFPGEIARGQVWRLITFVFDPPTRELSIWVVFGWYIFYVFGSTLEQHWGEFRYNLFLLIGVLCTVAAGMVGLIFVPAEYWSFYMVSNLYLITSVTFAFAILFPEFQILLFFIIPVKMKWVAVGILVLWALSAGTNLLAWLPILAALGNVAVFFGRDFLRGAQARQRRQKFDRERAAEEAEPFHRCVVCGKTDRDDPDMEFAYKDGKGYCRDHWDQMEDGK